MTQKEFNNLRIGDTVKIIDAEPFEGFVGEDLSRKVFKVETIIGYGKDVGVVTVDHTTRAGLVFRLSLTPAHTRIVIQNTEGQVGARHFSCECGARSIGVADHSVGHSSWCPVHAC